MSRDTRRRVAVALWLLAGVTTFCGVSLQSRWDRACQLEEPGTHWNGDDWLCERN